MGIENELKMAQNGDWEKIYKSLQTYTSYTASKFHIQKQEQDDILHDVLADVLTKMDSIKYGEYIKTAIKYRLLTHIRDKKVWKTYEEGQ